MRDREGPPPRVTHSVQEVVIQGAALASVAVHENKRIKRDMERLIVAPWPEWKK